MCILTMKQNIDDDSMSLFIYVSNNEMGYAFSIIKLYAWKHALNNNLYWLGTLLPERFSSL